MPTLINTLGQEEPCSRKNMPGPLGQGPPHLSLVSWSLFLVVRGTTMESSVWEGDQSTDIELLETFANSPLELSHGMVESSSNPLS